MEVKFGAVRPPRQSPERPAVRLSSGFSRGNRQSGAGK
jgi:hypothetical protein